MNRSALAWSLRTRIPFTRPRCQLREWRAWAEKAQALLMEHFDWFEPFTAATLATRNPEAMVLIGQQLTAFLKAMETAERTGDADAILAVLFEHAPVLA